MQETRIRSLVQEDPTGHGVMRPVGHNYGAWALWPASHNHCACVTQGLSSTTREASAVRRLRTATREQPPARCNQRKACRQQRRPSTAKNKSIIKKKFRLTLCYSIRYLFPCSLSVNQWFFFFQLWNWLLLLLLQPAGVVLEVTMDKNRYLT